MASIFLTVLFVNPLLYRAGIRCRALLVCVLAVLFGLMGGYAAGSYRNLGPSITIFVLGAAVFIFIIFILYLLHKSYDPSKINILTARDQRQRVQLLDQDSMEASESKAQSKAIMYLHLIGSIGATVTYQAGFAPPRSFWPDNSNGHAMGNPALRDMDARRYRIFFFLNTMSFAASTTVMGFASIILLRANKLSFYTSIQVPTALYAIGILGAYAAGSSSGWSNTYTYVVALVAPLLFCIFIIDPMVNLFGKLTEWLKVFDE